jgi:hypothetical protein
MPLTILRMRCGSFVIYTALVLATMLLPMQAQVTVTDPLTVQSLNNIQFADLQTGTDCGAKVQAADAVLGSSSGEIWVSTDCGTTWTTAVTFHGPRKIKFINGGSYSIQMGNLIFQNTSPVLIDCGGRQNAVLHFKGTGVAIKAVWDQFAPAASFNDWGYGIRDCALIGPGGIDGVGNAGTGIQIGDATHGTGGFLLYNSEVAGFALGITWGSVGSWGTKCDQSNFLNNTQNFLYDASGGGPENLEFDHCTFHQTTSPKFTNDVQITNTSTIEWSCHACSFDNSQIAINASPFSHIRFVNKHQETLIDTTIVPMVISSGNVTDDTPDFQWDSPATAAASGVSVSGGTYSIRNGGWAAQPGAPITNAIVQSGSGNVIAQNPLLLAANVGGIKAGGTGYIFNCDPTNGFCDISSAGGASYGAQFFNILSPNAATGGQLRLADGDSIQWRDHANRGNVTLDKNSFDEVRWNGIPLTQTLGSGTSTTNGTAIAAGSSQAQPAITIPGATATDTATCSLNTSPPPSWQTGIQILAAVVTSNTVTPWLSNPTAGSITPVPATLRCRITR